MSIIIEGLNHIYSEGTLYQKHALKDVSLRINQGEFIGLIGHTGSGKSTLIQHLNGILKANSGAIYYDDTNIYSDKYDFRSLRRKVGLVFQYPEHQLFEMTVFKDVAFGPGHLGLSEKEVKSRVEEALAKVGITEDLYEKSPFELSGGQKRRVAIAGVLAMKPEVLILDEPTAGLDPKGRDDILDEINKLYHQEKMTIILVSHSMEDIARYVDRIIVMEKGQVLYNDQPKKVFGHYKELENVGLAAPQVTYLMHALKDKGFTVDTEVTTVEEAKIALLKLLNK